MFAYLVLRGKVCLNPQFANLSSSSMGAIGPGIKCTEDVLEFPSKVDEQMNQDTFQFHTQGGAYMELEQTSPEIDCLLIW